MLGDLPLGQTEDADTADPHRSQGMPSSSPVGARIGPAHRDLVALCDQLLDGDPQIRMPARYIAHLLDALQPRRLARQGSVVDEVRGDQLAGAIQLLLEEDRPTWRG